MYKQEVMLEAAAKAKQTMSHGDGGPFGAAIVHDGEVISVASNTVLADHDPAAHAEVNAIREACRKLGTHDLSGYELYATGSPCPMCLSATIWSNIKTVYYSGTYKDAERVGFRDDHISKFIKGGSTDRDVVDLEPRDNQIACELYDAYQEQRGTIY